MHAKNSMSIQSEESANGTPHRVPGVCSAGATMTAEPQPKNPVQSRWIVYDNWEHEFSVYYDEQEAKKEYEARIKQINDAVGEDDEYEGEEEVYLCQVISKAEVVEVGRDEQSDDALYRLISYDRASHSNAKSTDKVLEELRTTPVICLCGSTRFTREMLIKQWELTKQGYIVVGWCALPDDYYQGGEKAHVGDQEGVKDFVDEIHKRKIDISDEVLVIDVDGYIGTSTRSEIDYAIKHGKPVRYLSVELRTKERDRG